MRSDTVKSLEFGLREEALGALLLGRRSEIGDRDVRLVEILERLEGRVLADDQDDAAVDIVSGKGDPLGAVGVNGGRLRAEVDRAVLGVGPALRGALADELDLVGIAEGRLGDQPRNVDIEADQFTLFIDEAERRRLAGHADDQLASPHDFIEPGLFLSVARPDREREPAECRNQTDDKPPRKASHFRAPLVVGR